MDNLNNLYAACIGCSRSKDNGTIALLVRKMVTRKQIHLGQKVQIYQATTGKTGLPGMEYVLIVQYLLEND